MRGKQRRGIWLQIWLLSVLLSIANGVEAGTMETVVGRNDIAVDRASVQEAINRAGSGGRVVLQGSFQLDGEPLLIDRGLTLEGAVVDNDGDGLDNEDWLDGVDNDGDELVDEDDWEARLMGITDASGEPIPETDRTVVFNRAIFVRGLEREVRGLKIRNLRFSGHFRAITLEPDTGSSGGTVCENLFSTPGSLANPRIEGNRFDNNDRAIELEGRTRQARIADNVIEATSNIGIIVEGVEMGCPLIGGGFDTFPIGVPEQSMVVDNMIFDSTLFAIFNFNSAGSKITHNLISEGLLGILSEGDPRVRVDQNEILGMVVLGIELAGSAEGGLVAENMLSGGFFGVVVDPGGAGYQIEGNSFEDVLFAEILLDFGTTGNRVIASRGDRVIDDGVDNIVTIE